MIPISGKPEIGARSPSVAVITTTAGGATTVVDPLATRGITIAPPSAETFARLAAVGITVAKARIVDLTIAGTRYETMKAALDILLSAPEFDLVVAVVGSSARFHPELAVKPVIDSAGAGKPIAAFIVPDAPQALAQLSAAGIPSFVRGAAEIGADRLASSAPAVVHRSTESEATVDERMAIRTSWSRRSFHVVTPRGRIEAAARRPAPRSGSSSFPRGHPTWPN